MAKSSKRLLRALLPVAAALAGPVLILMARTWRLRWIAGTEALDRLAAEGRPAVYAHWHHGLYSTAFPLYRRQEARGVGLVTLISRSRDGELVARMCRPLRLGLIRGSGSRGALHALRALHRAVSRRRRSALFALDGPRGPAREAQPGALMLARTAEVPMVPLAAVADRAWRLRSWDRLVIPKPFARVILAAGEPYTIDRSADLEVECRRLERQLDELQQECEEEQTRTGRAASPVEEGGEGG